MLLGSGDYRVQSPGAWAEEAPVDPTPEHALSGGGVYLQEGYLEFRRSFELPPGPIEAGDLDEDAEGLSSHGASILRYAAEEGPQALSEEARKRRGVEASSHELSHCQCNRQNR